MEDDNKRDSQDIASANFPQLDDDDHEVSVDAFGDSPASKLGDKLNFNMSDYSSTFLAPGILIGIWFVVFLLELLLTGTTAKGLLHWPVVVGNLSTMPLVKGVTAFAVKHTALHAGIGGLLMWLLIKVLSILMMFVSLVISVFMHASWGHLILNVGLFILLCIFYYFVQLPMDFVVKRWFMLSLMSIGIIWLVVEMLSMVVKLIVHKPTFFSAITTSNSPVIGASAGLFGLLGLGVILAIKNIRASWQLQLSTIVMTCVSLALLYTQFVNIQGIKFSSESGALILFTTLIHVLGFLIGVIQGCHLRIDVQPNRR